MKMLDAYVDWYCPECGKTDRTRPLGTRQHRMHICPKLRYLSAPLVRRGDKARLVLNEREDYVGKEKVQLDPERRRPVMNITTVRDDGQDLIVYAPTATSRGNA